MAVPTLTDITKLDPYASPPGGAVSPSLLSGVWTPCRTTTTSHAISRLHYDLVSTPIGENEHFVIGGTFNLTTPFRGTFLRLEGLDGPRNRLEIDRWSDGGYRVVRNRYAASDNTNENVQIGGTLPALPVGREFTLQLEAKLSRVDGQALTIVRIDGREVFRSTTRNWSNVAGEKVERARYGIVDGHTPGQVHVIDAYLVPVNATPPPPPTTDPCQAVKDELEATKVQLAAAQKLAIAEKARADEANQKIANAISALGYKVV